MQTAASEQARNVVKGEKVLRWSFNSDEGWNFFAFNPLDGSLSTGSEVIILAKHFGVWLT